MFNIVKGWISMILVIGIVFTLMRMIMPNTNLKKYIESIIGIVTIISIITPVLYYISNYNLTEKISENIGEILSRQEETNNYDSYAQINNEEIKKEFVEKIQEDIKVKLKNKINQEPKVKVLVNDAYNIEKVEVKLNGNSSIDVRQYISNEYDISTDKIEIN